MRHPLTELLLVAALAVSGGCATTPIGGLIEQLDSKDAAVRGGAEGTLEATGSAAIKPVAKALEEGTPQQRRSAARVLTVLIRKLVKREPYLDLFARKLADEDANVVVLSLRALGLYRANKQVDAIVRILREHPDLGSKRSAAEALGRIGNSESTAALAKIAASESAPVFHRVLAVRALGQGGKITAALDALLAVLDTTGEPPLRAAAEEAVTRILLRTPIVAKLLTDVYARAGGVLRDSLGVVITRAGPSFSSDVIYNALLQHPRASMRAAAVRSLTRTHVVAHPPLPIGRQRMSVIKGWVITALQDPDTSVQAAAAWAAGKLDAAEAAGILVKLLSHADVGVRHNAVVALRKITNQTFGYQATAPPLKRQPLVKKWREAIAVEPPK